MLPKISKALAVLALFAVPIAAGQQKLDYGRILRQGCSVDQLAGNVWRAYVWADYQDSGREHDFTMWLSERSNRRKAMKDCDEWLTAADKKRGEATKTKTASRQGRTAD
jgi:hypothetical protein